MSISCYNGKYVKNLRSGAFGEGRGAAWLLLLSRRQRWIGASASGRVRGRDARELMHQPPASPASHRCLAPLIGAERAYSAKPRNVAGRPARVVSSCHCGHPCHCADTCLSKITLLFLASSFVGGGIKLAMDCDACGSIGLPLVIGIASLMAPHACTGQSSLA